MPHRILLASHGTEGAKAAEQAVLDMCFEDTVVTHLYVIPDFWKHMLGDDWLNNQIIQERFGKYLETELQKEANDTISRVQNQLKSIDVKHNCLLLFGKPQECLLDACSMYKFDFIVTGSQRPKLQHGLRSRMTTKKLAEKLSVSHIQIPYPNTKH